MQHINPPTADASQTDDELARALALLDEWAATPEHAHHQQLARWKSVLNALGDVDRRPSALDAALIPLA